MTANPAITTVVIIIAACLLFSAFCSGMEIAFVASNKLKLEVERKKNNIFNSIISVFLKEPGQYITTILVGYNIALVIYSLQMTELFNWMWGYRESSSGWMIVIETVILTVIIIFIGEFLPKAIVRGNPNMFMKAFAVPIYLIYLILYPIARLSIWLSVGMMKLAGLKINSEGSVRNFDRIELEHLVDEAAENVHVEPESEIKLFRNAMDFSELKVRDCMVPKVYVEAVDITDSIGHVSDRFIGTGHSHILVYDGSIDKIIGYVKSKDLFKKPASIKDVLKSVDFVPESLPAQKLLTTFIKNNRSMGVVIDEYGATAGIVSMEDVLEEIFGEIRDEYDSEEDSPIEKVYDNGVYEFSGCLEVKYLNEKYNLGIPESDDYYTLAGYVIFYYEGIPAQGDVIKFANMEIEVLGVNNSKIELLKVTVL